MFLFHLLEWMNVPYTINVNELVENWMKAENMDSWSQLVIKHTKKSLELATKVPESGIWEMKRMEIFNSKNGCIVNQLKMIMKAFFLQITQKDDYLYEGADLGNFSDAGRLMSDDFQLSERAKTLIKALRSQYKSDLIDISMLSEEDLLGDFKIM